MCWGLSQGRADKTWCCARRAKASVATFEDSDDAVFHWRSGEGQLASPELFIVERKGPPTCSASASSTGDGCLGAMAEHANADCCTGAVATTCRLSACSTVAPAVELKLSDTDS